MAIYLQPEIYSISSLQRWVVSFVVFMDILLTKATAIGESTDDALLTMALMLVFCALVDLWGDRKGNGVVNCWPEDAVDIN